ncbi:metallophosphoesterase [Nocardioidaceae bacterium SCSIO 66511]|nr:metallophosphoesterase [Nocardioidaceae bacterium SCSIO 66511]
MSSVRPVAASLAACLTFAGLTTLSAITAGSARAAEDRPTYGDMTHFTGEFHAHTEVSDGVEMPDDAFDHVAANSDADFFTVSEHDVLYDRRNSDDFTGDWRDAVSQEWRYLHERSDAYNESQDDVVTIAAEEITWYDDSGHMNLFNTDWMATARAEGDSLSFGAATGDLKYDLPTFYARLKQDPDAIAQFNHPDPDGKGSFAGFAHLDPEVDDRVELIEAKNDTQRKNYQAALDAGWHVAPVWNGDEHSANWVTGDDAITGIWAAEKSRDAVYDAMRNRSMYSTEDVNTVLRFGADDQLMGSVLPADTSSVDLDVALTDADEAESFTSVQVLKNDGVVAYDVPVGSSNEVTDTHELPVDDGDYLYVRATQADGDVIVSAPVWVGETTRGADYAPTIEVDSEVPSTVEYGDRIELPEVVAEDDSGTTPDVSYEVWDDNGEVRVRNGSFTVRSYSDHVIVVKATDAAGNVGAEMIRLQVSQDDADPEGVFRYLGATPTVAEEPTGAGISVSTDAPIEQAYAQVRRAGRRTWDDAPVLTSERDSTYEINTIGKSGDVYQDTVTGQPLRSHEFDLSALQPDKRYEYRFGVAVDGSEPESGDEAWTGVRGTFVAGGKRSRPIYLLGDAAAESRRPADLDLFGDTLETLRRKEPRGDTLIQTGDLVASGVHREYWEDAFDRPYADLGLQLAPVVGDGESDFDREYNILSPKRNSIFSNMYALPDSGPIGESNYSFDRANVHVAVLNTVYDLESQLDWLVDDIRGSDQPWTVVVGHRSYFGGKGADGPGMAKQRERISQLFTRLGVDLYVGGHDNVYKRSRIYDGRLAKTPQEKADGTTFVTLGSAGPRFGENREQHWDDVVVDDNIQLGTALRASPSRLAVTTYARDGERVDRSTLRRQLGSWKVSTAELNGDTLNGIGLVSHRGSRRTVTVEAVSYDAGDRTANDRRLVEVKLDHRGAEQWVAFDEPLQVGGNDTVEVRFWDSPRKRRQLRAPLIVQEGLAGDGTSESPYLVDSPDDISKVRNDPTAAYRVTADLDLTDVEMTQIGADQPFTGDFDGNGHDITAMTTEAGGLFQVNDGSIHDLGIVDADVSSADARTGVLADSNTGSIERVYTTGIVTGQSRVGGIVGDNAGILRDAYSTARVQSATTEAGGTVGVALAGSTTERVYASGSVGASTKNAGGVAGYGYTSTTLRNSLAVNPKVSAPTYSHRVLGRVLAGDEATLANNWAGEGVVSENPSAPGEPSHDNLMGATASAAQTKSPDFYRDSLGWDLDDTWLWNEKGERPVLRATPEEVEPPTSDPGEPDLPQDADGAFTVSSVADLKQVTRFPDERYRLAADLDLSQQEDTTIARSGFSGDFDGAGHRISGFRSSRGGLFPLVTEGGTIHDLALVGAAVDTAATNVGLLVDSSRGTIERVSTAGTIYGGSTVGGVVGYSYGELRNSHSSADVYAADGRQAGGIAGITGRGSVTEFTYATGHVEVIEDANAGGISGYAYSGTTVRHNMALNSAVTATGYAHRVVARVLAGETATLVDNAASEQVDANEQSVPETGPATLNGQTRTATEVQSAATFRAMGWDFEKTWKFDRESGVPVLRALSG